MNYTVATVKQDCKSKESKIIMIKVTKAYDSMLHTFFINKEGVFLQISNSEDTILQAMLRERALPKYSMILKEQSLSLINLKDMITNGLTCYKKHNAIKLLVRELIYLRDNKQNIDIDVTEKRLNKFYLLPISKKDIELSKRGNSIFIKVNSIAKYLKTNVKGLREMLEKNLWTKMPTKYKVSSVFYIELEDLLRILLQRFEFEYEAYQFDKIFKLFMWLKNSAYPELSSLKNCSVYLDSEYELIKTDTKIGKAIDSITKSLNELKISVIHDDVLNMISKATNVPVDRLKKIY